MKIEERIVATDDPRREIHVRADDGGVSVEFVHRRTEDPRQDYSLRTRLDIQTATDLAAALLHVIDELQGSPR